MVRSHWRYIPVCTLSSGTKAVYKREMIAHLITQVVALSYIPEVSLVIR